MVTTALLLILQTTPDVQSAFRTGDSPRKVRLVEAPGETTARYETWTRAELRAESNRLDELRPGIVLPITMLLVGLTGGGVAGLALGIAAGNFFGIAVGLAIGLTTTIVVCIGLAVLGTLMLVRNVPERRALTREIQTLDDIYREGPAYFQRPGQQLQPCVETPPPQVMGPSYPITLVEF